MKRILKKEMVLAASPLSYLFLAAVLLTLTPGYPILVCGFFVCLGLFQSFQTMREAGDILYSILLPIAKRDIVKGKYLFCVLIEGIAFVLITILTLLRMTVLRDVAAYRNNALMNANPFFLGCVLLLFAGFNSIFLGGFFKTAYRFGKPFVFFLIYMVLLVFVAEALHHIPPLAALNAFGFEHLGLQLATLSFGLAVFTLVTLLSLRLSIRRFERIDL